MSLSSLAYPEYGHSDAESAQNQGGPRSAHVISCPMNGILFSMKWPPRLLKPSQAESSVSQANPLDLLQLFLLWFLIYCLFNLCF